MIGTLAKGLKTMCETCEVTTDKMHPFEKAGLGKAPFKFVGYSYEVGPVMMADGITQIGAPGQPMGTCDYCLNGIANVYRIKSADGNVFRVGCDCVEKLYGDKNAKSSQLANDKVYQQVQAMKRKVANEARHAREAKKIADGKMFLESHKELLEKTESTVRPGTSLWDRYDWYLRNAGNKGKLQIIAELTKVINAKVE